MASTWEQLEAAFVADHRVMTRGYVELLRAIKNRDFGSATQIAAELDRLAGPHIEFEQEYLYPEVQKIRGQSYASRLYDEHAEVLSAIVELKGLSPDSDPDDGQLSSWTEKIQHGLDHAAACGSLLSHLEAQSAPQQQQLLQSLRELREQGHRWSDLEHSWRQRS